MGNTTKTACNTQTYTQVTASVDTFAVIYNRNPKPNGGQDARIHLGAVAPANDTDLFMVLNPDEFFPKPKGLDGHIWVLMESETENIIVMES